jgi:hypothetical protein
MILRLMIQLGNWDEIEKVNSMDSLLRRRQCENLYSKQRGKARGTEIEIAVLDLRRGCIQDDRNYGT